MVSYQLQGTFLPVSVDADLEFNSVKPPPDKSEEEVKATMASHQPSHVKNNSKREISKNGLKRTYERVEELSPE